MFGYFGKGYMAPPPGAPPTEKDAAKLPVSAAEIDEVTIIAASPPSEDTLIQSRLAQLRAEIAAKKMGKEMQIQALRARQAKQAAYGRGETSAGKRSESEIAIGVSSGYYSGYNGYNQRFGDLTDEIADSANEVKKATQLVKALTEDIKAGSATSSELKKAMKDLTRKAKKAELLANQAGELKGYGEEEKSPWSFITIIAGIGLLAFFLMPRG
jgi:ElaB/YqjD/DUF883 family membrane-anchored ribosome-binding protein